MALLGSLMNSQESWIESYSRLKIHFGYLQDHLSIKVIQKLREPLSLILSGLFLSFSYYFFFCNRCFGNLLPLEIPQGSLTNYRDLKASGSFEWDPCWIPGDFCSRLSHWSDALTDPGRITFRFKWFETLSKRPLWVDRADSADVSTPIRRILGLFITSWRSRLSILALLLLGRQRCRRHGNVLKKSIPSRCYGRFTFHPWKTPGGWTPFSRRLFTGRVEWSSHPTSIHPLLGRLLPLF